MAIHRYQLALVGVMVGFMVVGTSAQTDPASTDRLEGASDILDIGAVSGIAIAPDKRVYIADADQDRIVVTDRDGARRDVLTGPQDAPLLAPSDVAVSAEGHVFVADTGNGRIAIFDEDGGFLKSWGQWGTRPGQFINPRGICIHEDQVLVADTGNDRIQVFDLGGVFVRQLGARGDDPGQFRSPAGVAMGDDGTIYVADSANHRVQRIAADGTAQTWGDWGAFPGLFSHPTDVEIHSGQIYITDLLSHRVQIFSPTGTFVDQWGMHAVVPREGGGRIHYPVGLAAAADGSFFAVAEAFERRAQTFDPTNPPKAETMPTKRGQQSHFGQLLSLAANRLAVWEPEARLVYLFDVRREQPINIAQFGEYGHKFGQFGRISAMTLADRGETLFVVDAGNDRLMRFHLKDVDAEKVRYNPMISRFDTAVALAELQDAAELATMPEIIGMAVGPDGYLYLLDSRNRVVLVVDRRFELVRRINHEGFIRPCDLAFNATGDRMYISDAWARTVFVLDDAGTLVTTLNPPEQHAYIRPFSVTGDSDGRLFVCDTSRDHILRFNETGRFLGSFGGTGSDVEQLWAPGQIAADEDRVFVVDYGNHRCQTFSSTGEWLAAFGAGRVWTRDRRPPARETESPSEPKGSE